MVSSTSSLEPIARSGGSMSQLELRSMELTPTPHIGGSIRARPSPLQPMNSQPAKSSPQLSNLGYNMNLGPIDGQLSPMAARRLNGVGVEPSPAASGSGGSFTASGLKSPSFSTNRGLPLTIPLTLAQFRDQGPSPGSDSQLHQVIPRPNGDPSRIFSSQSCFDPPSSPMALTAAGGGSFSIKRNPSLTSSRPLKSVLKVTATNDTVNDLILAENAVSPTSSGNLPMLSQSMRLPLSRIKSGDFSSNRPSSMDQVGATEVIHALGSLTYLLTYLPSSMDQVGAGASIERRNSVRWSNTVLTCDPDGIEGMESMPPAPGSSVPDIDSTSKGFRLLSKLFGSFGSK